MTPANTSAEVNIVQRANMGMIQARDDARLTFETLAPCGIVCEMLGEDFDRNGAIEARILGFVDLAHPAGAEWRQALVRTELGS